MFSHVEDQSRTVTDIELYAIAEALGVSISELLGNKKVCCYRYCNLQNYKTKKQPVLLDKLYIKGFAP